MTEGKQQPGTGDRRFIEESFPVKEVGAASAKEKTVRQGHISTLHTWWARRPLAASRATAYAALVPYPPTEEEREDERRFIIDLCQWDNSNNQKLLERARSAILGASFGTPPKVLDPFAGGGSYPLEALRLGCQTYCSDYNPVAVLVEKATLDYPRRFSRPFDAMPNWATSRPTNQKQDSSAGAHEEQLGLLDERKIDSSGPPSEHPLLNAVRFWGKWILAEARRELGVLYPADPDGSIPIAYIWAHTIPCQNPKCGEDIPLMRGYWLARKGRSKVALYPSIANGKLRFQVAGDGYGTWPKNFDADTGTVGRAVATCLVCGATVDSSTLRRQFNDGISKQKMLAVVLKPPKTAGKRYRVANDADTELVELANRMLVEKARKLSIDWGIQAIPDEPLPPKQSHRAVGSQLPLYGFRTWGDLFNPRQKLELLTFVEKVRLAYERIAADSPDESFAQAIVTYLALGVDRLADFGSILCMLNVTGGRGVVHTFGRPVLQMVWDYAESNPFNPEAAGWPTACAKNEKWIQHVAAFQIPNESSPHISQESATELPWKDDFFDAVLTDPPYYDNVPYSYLSDFFYVWLKRSTGFLHPDLFSTPLTPKSAEIVAYDRPDGGLPAGKRFFEDNLRKSFREVFRILKPSGISVLVYAHKSTAGWETVINALLDSGLVISGAWPLRTEMQARINANETASLASSIYIVARKTPRQPTGFYNDVRQELSNHLDSKLHRLWEEGIGGADFFIAAIGSAIEVFGKYDQVIDYEGNVVRADRLLEEVRTIATDYAVRQILHNGFAAEISALTRFYVLWRWNYGEALVPFDEGNKLARSCGMDLAQQFGKNGFIKKDKGLVRLLGPQARKLDDLDDPRDLIDVLHKGLLLWEKGKRGEMLIALAEKGHGKSDAFYRVAQAISETLPNESKEKKLLDGFLAGRERVQKEVEKSGGQIRMKMPGDHQ